MVNLTEMLKNNKHITIDFVGDSVTWGLTLCRAEETYVAKFTKFLAEAFKDCTVQRYDGLYDDDLGRMQKFDGPVLISLGNSGIIDVIRNGIGGNTVLYALNRIDDFTGSLANGKRPDITFLMFGINDSLTTVPEKYATPDEFKTHYKRLIDEIRRRNPDTAIIMLSATYNDHSVTGHCLKSKELAQEEDIPYIDLHKLWMEHYDENADNYGQGNWLRGNGDACHPTPVSAEITAKYIFEKFMEI